MLLYICSNTGNSQSQQNQQLDPNDLMKKARDSLQSASDLKLKTDKYDQEFDRYQQEWISTINSFKTDSLNIEKELDAFETNVNRNNTGIQKDIGMLRYLYSQQSLANATKKITEQQILIAILQAQNLGLQSNIQQYQDQIAQEQINNSNLVQQITSKQIENQVLQAQNNNLNALVDQLSQSANNTAQIVSDASGIEVNTVYDPFQAEQSVSAVNTNTSSIDSSVANIITIPQQINDDANSFLQNLTYIIAKYPSDSTLIQNMQNTVVSLKSQQVKLSQTLVQLQNSVSQLKTANANLQNQLNLLRNDYSNLLSQFNLLKAANIALQGQISQLNTFINNNESDLRNQAAAIIVNITSLFSNLAVNIPNLVDLVQQKFSDAGKDSLASININPSFNENNLKNSILGFIDQQNNPGFYLQLNSPIADLRNKCFSQTGNNTINLVNTLDFTADYIENAIITPVIDLIFKTGVAIAYGIQNGIIDQNTYNTIQTALKNINVIVQQVSLKLGALRTMGHEMKKLVDKVSYREAEVTMQDKQTQQFTIQEFTGNALQKDGIISTMRLDIRNQLEVLRDLLKWIYAKTKDVSSWKAKYAPFWDWNDAQVGDQTRMILAICFYCLQYFIPRVDYLFNYLSTSELLDNVKILGFFTKIIHFAFSVFLYRIGLSSTPDINLNATIAIRFKLDDLSRDFVAAVAIAQSIIERSCMARYIDTGIYTDCYAIGYDIDAQIRAFGLVPSPQGYCLRDDITILPLGYPENQATDFFVRYNKPYWPYQKAYGLKLDWYSIFNGSIFTNGPIPSSTLPAYQYGTNSKLDFFANKGQNWVTTWWYTELSYIQQFNNMHILCFLPPSIPQSLFQGIVMYFDEGLYNHRWYIQVDPEASSWMWRFAIGNNYYATNIWNWDAFKYTQTPFYAGNHFSENDPSNQIDSNSPETFKFGFARTTWDVPNV